MLYPDPLTRLIATVDWRRPRWTIRRRYFRTAGKTESGKLVFSDRCLCEIKGARSIEGSTEVSELGSVVMACSD